MVDVAQQVEPRWCLNDFKPIERSLIQVERPHELLTVFLQFLFCHCGHGDLRFHRSIHHLHDVGRANLEMDIELRVSLDDGRQCCRQPLRGDAGGEAHQEGGIIGHAAGLFHAVHIDTRLCTGERGFCLYGMGS